MTSLKRKVSMRRDAAAARETARKAAVVGRTGQVSRAVVAGVPVEGAIVQSEGTATVVDGLGSDVARLDDGTVWDAAESVIRVPVADDYIDDLAQRQDEANDALIGLDEWRDDRYDVDEAAAVEGDGLRADVEQAGREVEAAQAEAAQAAADALDAAAASAAASQVAADAKLEAEAATSAAAQAAQDATDKSAAAQAAAEAYAEAQAAAAEAAAVAEASGDASAKADAARLAAEAAAAADASAKADAAEAAAKADAAAAQATADAAAGAASDAQDAADSVRFLAEGLYQVIPSVSEPTTSPTGALKSGDQWWKIGGPGTEYEGKWYGVAVWNGEAWQDRQLVGNSILVPGSVGNVLIEDGAVNATKMSADFFVGREFYGSRFVGGRYDLATIGSSVPLYENPGTSIAGWYGFGGNSPISLDTGRYRTAPSSLKALAAPNGISNAQHNSLGLNVPPGTTGTVTFWVYTGSPSVSVTTGVTGGSIPVNYGTQVVTVPTNVWTRVVIETQVSGAPLGRVSISSNTTDMWIDDIVISADTGTQTGVNIYRDVSGIARVENTGPSGAYANLVGGALATNQPLNRFALKSQLNGFTAADGTHAWVTSEGREYVRAGGAWRAVATPIQAQKRLWTGAWYLSQNQVVNLSETITDQDTGIILAWSAGTHDAGANNDWNYEFIPKAHVQFRSGAGINMSLQHGNGSRLRKYVYLSNGSLTGHVDNTTAPNNLLVLREVIGV